MSVVQNTWCKPIRWRNPVHRNISALIFLEVQLNIIFTLKLSNLKSHMLHADEVYHLWFATASLSYQYFSELNVQPSQYTKDKIKVNSNSYSNTVVSHIKNILHFLAKIFFLKGTFINVCLEIFITNCLQCTKCQG